MNMSSNSSKSNMSQPQLSRNRSKPPATSATSAAGAASTSSSLTSGPSTSNANASSTANTSSNGSNGVVLGLDATSLNVDLLPILHDVIRVIEKDNQDVSQRTKDSIEASHKIQELYKKIESIREQIYKLPGIERSKPEQLQQLDTLKKQLEMKKALIAKYKTLNLKVSGLSGGSQFNVSQELREMEGGAKPEIQDMGMGAVLN